MNRRREWLAGSLLFVGLMAVGSLHAAGKTDALLLSCMDYRLVDETEAYMSERGLRDQYDHVILAGASLGVVNDQFPNWGETFRDHVSVAIELHGIRRIIVIDHRDCGAYREILGEDFAADPDAEREIHAEKLRQFRDQMSASYPSLEVELLLMDLAGAVEPIE